MRAEDDALLPALAALLGAAVLLHLRSGERVIGLLRSASADVVELEDEALLTIRTAAIDGVAAVPTPEKFV